MPASSPNAAGFFPYGYQRYKRYSTKRSKKLSRFENRVTFLALVKYILLRNMRDAFGNTLNSGEVITPVNDMKEYIEFSRESLPNKPSCFIARQGIMEILKEYDDGNT